MNINSYIQKLRLMGANINTVEQLGEQPIYTAYTPALKESLFVIIPEDVKTVKQPLTGLVEQCEKLIVIGGSGLNNSKSMFECCKRADSIDLSNFDTSNIEVMENMFRGCKVNSIDLTNLNTSKAKNMIGMFCDFNSKTLDLSKFDTRNVNNMSRMFTGCQAERLDLRNFDTYNVVTMREMFTNCSATYINLSSFNTENTASMAQMFACTKAEILDLRSFNTDNVLTMACMFFDCKSKYIDIRNFNTYSIKDMDSMFERVTAEIKSNDWRILEQIKLSREQRRTKNGYKFIPEQTKTNGNKCQTNR